MPPKKAQQQPQNPPKPFYVLPLFMNYSPEQSDPEKILRSKPINYKKCIDKTKIVEILKDKGLSPHLTPQGQIKPEGRKFICDNFKTVLQQATVQAPKQPNKKGPEPKKKGTGPVEPVPEENKQPTVELTLDKKCDNFVFLLDFPENCDQLKACMENGLKIDAVVVIEQKIKKGSNPPNYELLGRTYEQNELMSTLNTTKIRQQPRMQKAANQQQQDSRKISAKKMLKTLRRMKNQNPQLSNLIITEVPFEKDISHPQNNEKDFIDSTFTKLCSTSVERQKYDTWIKNDVKKVPMIQPLKEVVKKQVLVQQQKTGKKDANKQPEYETVQEVIETKYQSLTQNIKSDLKLYNQLSEIRSKNTQDPIKSLIQNCLFSVELQLGKSNQPVSQINPELSFKKLTSKPLAKVNFIDSLKQNLRKVESFQKIQLTHNLIHQPKEISQKVNLVQIIHKNPQRKQILEFEFIMKTLTDFMRQQEPKLRWDFSDRIYREKLSNSQVLSQIQKQLLRDPKIYEGILKHDNLKLLCMAKINPPGRVLYSNDIFKPKAVPDFQNWLIKFKTMQNAPDEFLDYRFEQVGNLSLKRQKLTPTDNVVICDEKVTIGNDLFKVNRFERFGTLYGLKQLSEDTNEFWLRNTKQQISLSIFQKQHQFKKTSTITQTVKQEGSSEQKVVQKVIESIETQRRVEMWFRTDQFIMSHTPYPTINWFSQNKQNRSGQVKRQFGAKGQITSHLNDGSVRIFYLNGNISTLRNNQWQRVINDELFATDGSRRKLEIKEFTQGDKTIKIREDQTIFVEYSNGNSLIIFSDDTKVLHKKKQNIYETRTLNSELNEQVIVRLSLPKNSQVNIIGHGSAFAYLGFKNLSQRSVDGFLYQVWHNQFSTYLYNQKYEYEHKIYEDEIRIVHLSDGSLIKLQANDHISFAQGDYDPSEEKLKEKWNQVFALQQNHQVGVYDIHLTQGTIKTKDAESNYFKINVEEQNDIQIAVSFKISQDDKVTNNFGNGFHVPQQNYFLPVPDNCVPPRIFAFDNSSNEYYEYLTPQQVRQMEVSSSVQHTESYSVENKTIQQYTRQVRKNGRFDEDKKVVAFSKTPSFREYEIPGILLPRETRVNMSVQNDKVLFKCIEKIQWNKDFENVIKITQNIIKIKGLRLKEIQFGRN